MLRAQGVVGVLVVHGRSTLLLRPAVLLPAYRQRSVAQPLFCMRSALATPRPRLGQPLRWSARLVPCTGQPKLAKIWFAGGLVGSC